MAIFSTHGTQYSPPKVSRKLWVSLYIWLVLGFHSLKWWRALFGIAWPFHPSKPFCSSIVYNSIYSIVYNSIQSLQRQTYCVFPWSQCICVAFHSIPPWLVPIWVRLLALNGQLRLLVDTLPARSSAPSSGLVLWRGDTCLIPVVHQLITELSIPAPTSETASPFLVSPCWSLDMVSLHHGSAWPFPVVSKTGNSYLFLFQF